MLAALVGAMPNCPAPTVGFELLYTTSVRHCDNHGVCGTTFDDFSIIKMHIIRPFGYSTGLFTALMTFLGHPPTRVDELLKQETLILPVAGATLAAFQPTFLVKAIFYFSSQASLATQAV